MYAVIIISSGGDISIIIIMKTLTWSQSTLNLHDGSWNILLILLSK